MNRHARTVCCLLLLVPLAGRAQDDDKVSVLGEAEASKNIKIPYAFYSDLFGAAAAFLYARNGFLQEQSQLLVTGMVGTAGSGMLFVRWKDVLVPGFDRLFADPIFSVAYFNGDYAYITGNSRFPAQQAGTNGSSYDNYITGNGWDNYLRIPFRYLVPIGWGRDHVVPEYRLARGLLASGATGGESLNPLSSGRTFLEVRPFYRSLTINASDVRTTQKTNGVDVSLIWDNRDFETNPSVGQSLKLRWSRDFGWLDTTNPWTVVAGEVDQYFPLGPSGAFRQRVIALDVWTAVSPSWQYRADGTIVNRPPTFEGAYLGGWWRMRGYRFARFSDKAGISYAAEYRMIPRWNPFESWGWFQRQVGVDWVQLVPFAELGRVAPSWDLHDLHTAMKWDAGLGLRFLARGLLVRMDVAGSPEGATVQMMVEQPFQF